MPPVRRIHRALGLLLGCWLATLVLAGPPSEDEPKPGDVSKSQEKGLPGIEPGAVEVRFTDGGVLKLTLREEKLTFITEYGKLTVPIADITHIDFATRIPDDLTRKIEAAIRKLGSEEFKIRELASADLLKMGVKAYPALLGAAENADNEVRRRAKELLAKIKETVPPEQLEVRRQDVLHTKDSKFTGKIENATLQANTAQFGAVQVKLTDVMGLRSLAHAEPETAVAAIPDPGSLTGYANQFGTKLALTVTGRVDGSVWGTNVYTLDSTVAAAAVHAGVLKPGQTAVVKVEILMSPPAFGGSLQNGVMSAAYNAYPAGAYRFITGPRR
jgi:hypothetical protein